MSAQSKKKGWFDVFLDGLEKACNKLPVPAIMFFYLFIIIALAVVNAIAEGVPMLELILTNLIVVCAVWICERNLKTKPSKLIMYDRIELITPDKRDELKADLEKRLGVKIIKLDVGAVDFIRDMAMVRIIFDGHDTVANNILKLSKSQLQQF